MLFSRPGNFSSIQAFDLNESLNLLGKILVEATVCLW